MQDLEIILEINERIKRLERRQKSAAVRRTLFTIILIAVIAFLCWYFYPKYMLLKSDIAEFERIKPQIAAVAETVGKIDPEELRAANEKIKDIDFEALSEAADKINSIDLDSAIEAVNGIKSAFGELGGLFGDMGLR